VQELFKTYTFYLASGVEIGASLVIAFATLEALWSFLLLILRRGAGGSAKETIRISLGRWLALALEFELAADILRTAVAPTWNEIGQLAAIIVLRTALNYFLQREIDAAARRGVSHAG
jgi:uncharacterized membrane protein